MDDRQVWWARQVSVDDVVEAFRCALGSMRGRDAVWMDKLVTGEPLEADYRPSLHRGLARDLAARLSDLLGSAESVDAAVLAQAAVEVRQTQVIALTEVHASDPAHRATLNRGIAAQAAYILTATLALQHSVTGSPLPHQHIFQHLSVDGDVDLFALTAALETLLVDRDPEPLVVILTPLAHVAGDDEQRQLLDVADGIRSALQDFPCRVIVPGELIHPSTPLDVEPDELYFRERRVLLRASLVVVVAGGYDSWGAGCATAWCEAGGAQVVVLVDDPARISRVLGSGPFSTRILREMDPVQAGQAVADLWTDRRSVLKLHALDLRHTDRRIARLRTRLADWAQTQRATPGQPRLAQARRVAAVADSRELDSLTAYELRALIRELGPDAVDLVTALLDLPHAGRRPNPATTRASARPETGPSRVDAFTDDDGPPLPDVSAGG